MNKRNVGAEVRVSGFARNELRRRGRGPLLLSTALGCSLLVVAAAGPTKAQTISQHVEGDVTVTQDVVDGVVGIDVSSETGNITIDVAQVNVTNNGDGSGYAIGATTQASDKLISISLDESTATGTGRIFGIIAQAPGGSNILINAGAIEATGAGGYGVWALGGAGTIEITADSITTNGGIRSTGGGPRFSRGIWATSETGDVSVTSGSIETAGFASAGVYVEGGSGDVVIDSDHTSTAGDLSPGLGAEGHNVTITSGDVETSGDGSPGIYVPVATGDVTVTSGSVTTHGGPMTVEEDTYVSAGIAVLDGQNVSVTSNEITTTGAGGFGIAVSDVASATVDSGQITTTGDAATGITVDGVTGDISITSDSISTTGTSVVFDGEIIAAEGIYASGDGDITIDSGQIATEGQFAHGIVVEGNVGNVNVTSGELSTAGDSAEGILVQTTTGDITINAGTTATTGDYIASTDINPYGYFPDAIAAITNSGAVSVTSGTTSADGIYASAIGVVAYGGGDVSVNSTSASGAGAGGVVLQVDASYDPGSMVEVHSGAIANDGDGKASLVALGTDDVVVESGSIVSTGTEFYDAVLDQTLFSSGLTARSYDGDVTVTSGSVSTVGDFARGIVAIADVGSVNLTSDSVTTQSARGIQARAAGAIDIDSGTIHAAAPTGGQGAHAIMVTAGAGDVNIASDEIVTEGARSHGIYVANANGDDIAGIGAWRAATGGTGVLTIDSGSIDSSAWGMMIDHQGAIDITSGEITSGGSGIYVYGGDAVSIDSGSIETENGPGIVVWADEGLVDINSDHVVVGSGGDVGVFAKTHAGAIAINAGDTTTTATGTPFGNTADAVGGISQTGDITIVSGSTSTQGHGATGVYAFTDGAISVTSGSVTSAGDSGNGIFVGGNGDITIDSGEIHASGDGYEGAILVSAGEGDVTVDSDLIETTGANAHGIVIPVQGQAPSFGNRAAGGGTGMLTLTSGDIDVTGVGIFVDHVGDMAITSGTLQSGGPGLYVYGGGAVTIDSTSVETTNGPGIVVWGDDGLVDITSGHVLVGDNGDVGVFARTSSGDIVIHADDTTTTATGLLLDGYTADGVGAVSSTGDITIASNSVSTLGYASSGIFGFSDGAVSITSGSIVNAGDYGSGIYSIAGSITVDSGSVAVSGLAAYGMHLEAENGDASVTSGSVVNTAERDGDSYAYGIVVGATGDINLTSGTVSTIADEGFGIGTVADGAVVLSSGSVTTTGDHAAGIAVQGSSASVTTGDVSVSGAVSIGVGVISSGDIDIDVTGDVSSAQSWGILTQAADTSTITIDVASGASVSGADGAIGLDGTNAATTLNVMGELSTEADYAVLLGGGDDTVNLLTGANVNGGLAAGEGYDVLTLNSTVNEAAGVGQSFGHLLDFESLSVVDGYWTLTGIADTDETTTISGGTLKVTGALVDDVWVQAGGTLQIGDGGETGELFGDLVIDGSAIFHRSDEYDFGGDISGAGQLVKRGDASLVLSGAYNFTGATVVEGGTIKILNLPETAEVVVDDGVLDLTGQEQELSSLSGGENGEVAIDGGSLTVNQEGSTEFGGSITGDGDLTLTGGGTMNLTGDNTYTGPTTVGDFTLKVNGSITSDVTVEDGGTLGGSGTIGGDVELGDGAAVGPGNSPGTLTVVGDFTFGAGSTYVAEVEADGDHDQIDASGHTTIEDDVTLQIMAGNGDYARRSAYTILTSDLGVSGTFDTITTNLAFLDPHLVYSNTAVELVLIRNDVSFASFAANANQTSVADAIEPEGYGDPLFDALVVQSAAGSSAGYAALSGELYSGIGSVLVQQSRYAREAVLDRAGHAPDGSGGWGQLIGANLRFDGDADYAQVESKARGLIAGADTELGGWRAGVAVAYIKSDVDADALASSSDVKSTTVSAYAGGALGWAKLSVGASYSRHDVDATRTVAFPSFADATSADFEATGGQIFAEVSMQHDLGGVFLEPFAQVGYETLSIDGFTEDGGDAALTVDSSDRKVTTGTVGLRASGSFQSGMGQIKPYASVALRGVSGDTDTALDAAFANGAAFAVTGAPIDDGLLYEVGVKIDGGQLGFSASYGGMETDRWSDQQAKVGVSFRF